MSDEIRIMREEPLSLENRIIQLIMRTNDIYDQHPEDILGLNEAADMIVDEVISSIKIRIEVDD